jgi:hypothetical protein
MNRPSPRARRHSVGLLVATVPLLLVLVAGCGRLRRDATTAPTTAPSTTAAAAGSTSTSTAGSPPEGQTLASIEQQLATVNSQLSSVGGDLTTADSALNSQEGDPTR